MYVPGLNSPPTYKEKQQNQCNNKQNIAKVEVNTEIAMKFRKYATMTNILKEFPTTTTMATAILPVLLLQPAAAATATASEVTVTTN